MSTNSQNLKSKGSNETAIFLYKQVKSIRTPSNLLQYKDPIFSFSKCLGQ